MAINQSLSSQQKKRLFAIDHIAFKYERYKWGNELFLLIKGKARSALKGGILNVEILYHSQQVCRKQFSLPATQTRLGVEFHYKWGPLNQPYEKILGGSYTIKILSILQNQPPHIYSKLRKYKDKIETTYIKDVIWNQRAFASEQLQIKAFYKKRIANLGLLYKELILQTRKALSIKRDVRKGKKNPFIKEGTSKFDKNRWRYWFEKNFQSDIKKELASFQKFHKKLFCCRNKKAKANIEEYIFMLLRYSRILNLRVYRVNKTKMDHRDSSRIDPFGIKKEQAIINHLVRLLKETVALLKIKEKILPF